MCKLKHEIIENSVLFKNLTLSRMTSDEATVNKRYSSEKGQRGR